MRFCHCVVMRSVAKLANYSMTSLPVFHMRMGAMADKMNAVENRKEGEWCGETVLKRDFLFYFHSTSFTWFQAPLKYSLAFKKIK